jgi:hypothetical protein
MCDTFNCLIFIYDNMNYKDSHIANVSSHDIDKFLASAGPRIQTFGDLQLVLNELKLSVTVDANIPYWVQFIASLVRNVTILIGHFTLILTIYNTISVEKKLIKHIQRYCAKNVSFETLRHIIRFNIMPISKLELHDLKQTSDELIETMYSNFINGTNDKINIVITQSCETMYNDLLKYFAIKRLYMDKATMIKCNVHQKIIYIDGLTYVPNAVNLFQIADKNPQITFYVRVSDSDSRDKIKEIIIAKNIHQISNIIEHCKSIIEPDTKIYAVETINAMPHTQLGDDILKTNPKKIVFIFGCEGGGIMHEVLKFAHSYPNNQNILIRSYSPYFHENSDNGQSQNYSMNLVSCIITILATFY